MGISRAEEREGLHHLHPRGGGDGIKQITYKVIMGNIMFIIIHMMS